MNTNNNNSDFSLKEITKDKRLISWGAPVMLLVLLILSFGLMIPWLGHGFDEWHFIYFSTRGSQGLAEIFHYDGHPQATWSYIPSFRILGYNPIYWHLYSLIWRWLAVLSFWLCLKIVWPDNHRQNFFTAALFAIHPIFALQIFPISFYEIWLGYTLLFLSFFFTMLVVRNPEKHRIFTILAVALAVGHVFTSEYTWFVELMRPVFIWLVLPSSDVLRKKFSQTIKTWLPFCAIFISTLIWRGFFYTPLRKFFQVRGDLFANPGKTLLGWFADLIPDVSIVLVTSWYKVFSSDYVYLVRPLNIVLLALTILVAVIGNIYVRNMDTASQAAKPWGTEAVFLGLPSLLFGILPIYIASYSIHLTEFPYNSRFTIGMLPGAALISAAMLEKIVSKQNLRILLTVIVLSMSVSWHIRYTNDYRKVWVYQSGFLQQLTWRVPGLGKDTALFVYQPSQPDIDTSNAGFVLAGDFALSMALNSIYDQNPIPTESKLSYWYYRLPDELADIVQDSPLHAEHATTYFDGSTLNSLFLYYDPQNNRCLHLVNTQDQHYKQYPLVIRAISPYTTTNRIFSTLTQNVELRDEILGGNEHGWCFYYQKADLARQYQQWDAIPVLWQEAMEAKAQTEFGTEYLPFIEGFAHLAEWQKAQELTVAAKKASKGMNSILCPLWDGIEQSTPASAERDGTLKQVRSILECTSQ